MAVETCTVEQLRERLERDPHLVLVDVRSRDEYRLVHLAASSLIPLEVLTVEALGDLPHGGPVYLISNRGHRAERAAERLASAGVENVCVVRGGIVAWQEAGFPLIRGVARISIERQVRMIVGLVVALLGLWPGLHWLVVVVGLLFFFSGVFDVCLLAGLLKRLPYNRD